MKIMEFNNLYFDTFLIFYAFQGNYVIVSLRKMKK